MMADEATPSATSAAPSSVTATAPAATSAGGGIKTAAEVIEKILATPDAPATPPKDAKGKSTKAADKAPERRLEKLEAAGAARPATEATAEPDAEASALAKARFHLQHGDVALAIDAAFGDLKADGLSDGVREALARKLGVSSRQWEQVRRFEQESKRKLGAREQELSGIVERLKAEYAPYHNARKAYEAGDYDAAFKAAFGEDAADYQRKVIGQRVGKNPEVEKLRADLEAERAERNAAAQREQAAREQAEQQQQQLEYMRGMQAELIAHPDPEVAAYATKGPFIRRVFDVLQREYHRTGELPPLLDVVEHVRHNNVSVAEARAWAPVATTPVLATVSAAQASAPPAKPPVAKAPARALTQSRAAEATGKPRKETSAEIRERYQRQMESSAPD